MTVNTILNVFTLIAWWSGNKKTGDTEIAGEIRTVMLSLNDLQVFQGNGRLAVKLGVIGNRQSGGVIDS